MYVGHSLPKDAAMARLFGEDLFRSLCEASADLRVPVPIAGVPLFTYDGMIVPRIAGGGFSSLSDLISEATIGGKRQELIFSKAGATGVVGQANSLWNVGSVPAAGGTSPAFAAGAAPTRATTGALVQANPAINDTLHVVQAMSRPSTGTNLLLLYDRLFHGNHNIATTPQAVSGVPTRYQTSVLAPGNFISGEVTTALGVGAANVTFTYVDQDGNVAEAGAALALVPSSAANQVPFAAPNWFYPLNAGDTGARSITNITISAVTTGAINWFIGHPLAWIPQPDTAIPYVVDGINTAFNLAQVLTDACLAFLEIAKGATTATNYNGSITLVSG